MLFLCVWEGGLFHGIVCGEWSGVYSIRGVTEYSLWSSRSPPLQLIWPVIAQELEQFFFAALMRNECKYAYQQFTRVVFFLKPVGQVLYVRKKLINAPRGGGGVIKMWRYVYVTFEYTFWLIRTQFRVIRAFSIDVVDAD
jgi:hypothetical protein